MVSINACFDTVGYKKKATQVLFGIIVLFITCKCLPPVIYCAQGCSCIFFHRWTLLFGYKVQIALAGMQAPNISMFESSMLWILILYHFKKKGNQFDHEHQSESVRMTVQNKFQQREQQIGKFSYQISENSHPKTWTNSPTFTIFDMEPV